MDGNNKNFLRVLDREIATTLEERDDAQRKLTILKKLRDNLRVRLRFA